MNLKRRCIIYNIVRCTRRQFFIEILLAINYLVPATRFRRSIYIQQRKKQQLIDPDGNGRFSPTDPESHDMRLGRGRRENESYRV